MSNNSKGKIRRHKPAKTVVICSSASFYKEVIEVAKVLKKMGFKVAVPLTAGKMERTKDFTVNTYKTWFVDGGNSYARKTFLTKHHFKKIEKGDIVLVLNYEKNGKPGYIGGAVLAEMAIGLHFGKKIYILNDIDETVSYKEEILGALPIFLDGKLENIKK
jgi:hypothetical protein